MTTKNTKITDIGNKQLSDWYKYNNEYVVMYHYDKGYLILKKTEGNVLEHLVFDSREEAIRYCFFIDKESH